MVSNDKKGLEVVRESQTIQERPFIYWKKLAIVVVVFVLFFTVYQQSKKKPTRNSHPVHV